jgi:hypothetical protein
MRPARDKLTRQLCQLTLVVAVAVLAFVPAMQILRDHAWPTLTKPVIAGVILGTALCALMLLPRFWHQRLLFASIASVLMLGAAELTCSMLAGESANSIYEWDARRLYRLKPNSTKTFHRAALNGGDRIQVAINSQGFRGPELNSDGPRHRIVVYGDSFVEAEYSQDEKTFVRRLETELSANTELDVEAINAGVIGYGPDQVLLRMEEELPRLNPEVAVVCFFADNDLGDLLRNKLFRLDENGALQPHEWKLAPECRRPGTRGPYEPTLWRLTLNAIRGLQSRSDTTESYMYRWLQQCTEEYEDYVVRQDPLVRELQVDHYDADVSLTPGCDSANYKTELLRKIVERMQAVCVENSTTLVLVIIPSPADVIEDYDFCTIDRVKYPAYDPRTITGAMEEAAKRTGVPCVNLFDQFAESDPKQLYFRGGDNHWNDSGQQTAAKTVAMSLTPVIGRKTGARSL